ncbi:MAG: HIRAN domain-containing protein [Gallionella sp.]
MDRRSFISRLIGLCGGVAVVAPVLAQTPSRRVELQRSALAGFQYHQGEKLWPLMQVGDTLTLIREADNRFDNRAVRVEWHGMGISWAMCHDWIMPA